MLIEHPASASPPAHSPGWGVSSAAAPAAPAPAEIAAMRPAVAAVIARMLHRPIADSDVEDAVHETMRRAVEGRTRVRSGEPIGPWVIGVARHVALDALRRRRRELARTASDDDGAGEEVADDAAPSPEDHAEAAETRRKITAALGSLEAGPRRALVAFHVDGQSYQEIAVSLGVPMGTVATWIARSRKALSKALAMERGEGST
ncbi:MAG: sigma-70 family RNA polymerase sigma factor [Polyangiaceae bacterium]